MENNSFDTEEIRFIKGRLVCPRCGCPETVKNGKQGKQKWRCKRCGYQPRIDLPSKHPVELQVEEGLTHSMLDIPSVEEIEEIVKNRIPNSQRYFSYEEAALIFRISNPTVKAWVNKHFLRPRKKKGKSSYLANSDVKDVLRLILYHNSTKAWIFFADVPPEYEGQRLLTASSVAEITKIPLTTINYWSKEGFLKPVRNGKHTLFPVSVVKNLLHRMKDRKSIETRILFAEMTQEFMTFYVTVPICQKCHEPLTSVKPTNDKRIWACLICGVTVTLPIRLTEKDIKANNQFKFKTHWIDKPICKSCQLVMHTHHVSETASGKVQIWECECKKTLSLKFVELPPVQFSHTSERIAEQFPEPVFQTTYKKRNFKKMRPLERHRFLQGCLYAILSEDELKMIEKATMVNDNVSKTTFRNILKLALLAAVDKSCRTLRGLSFYTQRYGKEFLDIPLREGEDSPEIRFNTLSERFRNPKLLAAATMANAIMSAKVQANANPKLIEDPLLKEILSQYDQLHVIDGTAETRVGETFSFATEMGKKAKDTSDQSRGFYFSLDYCVLSGALLGMCAHYERLPNENECFINHLVDWTQKGIIYVLDRGYEKIANLKKLDDHGHWFVLRIKNSLTTIPIGSPIYHGGKIVSTHGGRDIHLVSDQEVLVGGKGVNEAGYRCRMITYWFNDPASGKITHVRLLTNLRGLSAEHIAVIYRYRWPVETSIRNQKSSFGLHDIMLKTPEGFMTWFYLLQCAYHMLLVMHRMLHTNCTMHIDPILMKRTFLLWLDEIMKNPDDPRFRIPPCSDPHCPYN